MLGTYASFLLVLGLSALVGQAVLAACGRQTSSSLSPAIGLAALISVAWGTVRLPGEGLAALIAIGALGIVAVAVLRSGVRDAASELRVGVPVALIALLAASLPFIVEGRFGILGTGLNPDMSQHLFAADRLAEGASERLISDGYPLGPHALVVAVSELGPSSVDAFNGLTLAIAVSGRDPAGRDRDRQRLRVQLPGARLARGRRAALGGDRGRARGSSKVTRSRRPVDAQSGAYCRGRTAGPRGRDRP